MVRDQMLCIVTPPRAHEAAALQRAIRECLPDLNALFNAVGAVHFASVVLLPPRANDDDQAAAGCSLMLELAIDEDIDHGALMNDIATRGLDLLWPLYAGHWEDAGRPDDRRAWLAGFLTKHINGAAGGFIGARDRTREQIRRESKLFHSLRDMLRARPVSGAEDTQTVASRVIESAWNTPDTEWAETPAPRSFWRNPKLTTPKRALLTVALLAPPLGFLSLLLLFGSLLAMAGVIALIPPWIVLGYDATIGPALFGASHGKAVAAIGLVVVPSLLLLGFAAMGSARLMSARLAYVILTALALISIPVVAVVVAVVLAVLWALGVQMSWWPELWLLLRALLHLVGFGALALAWMVAGAMTIALLFAAALLVSPRHLGGKALVPVFVLLLALDVWLLHLGFASAVKAGAPHSEFFAAIVARGNVACIPAFDLLAWLIPASTLVTLLLLSTLRFIAPLSDKGIRRWDRPRVADVERGQQVHKAVLAADSALAGKVGHMVSLAEVRRPVFFHATMLKIWLWLVTRIGHTGFVEGVLGHAQGIKFGHWHLVDGNRRLLFCSNFDGDFGSYLDDFIIGASNGINLFWRWTELRPRPPACSGQPAVEQARGFPPTRLLVFRGCKYEQWFKTFARDSMLPHLYRYEAYNDSSKDIARATRLRDALFAARSRDGDDQIMRALES